ncbi:hypothetical protein PG995_015886 [Apiospora arundinis]
MRIGSHPAASIRVQNSTVTTLLHRKMRHTCNCSFRIPDALVANSPGSLHVEYDDASEIRTLLRPIPSPQTAIAAHGRGPHGNGNTTRGLVPDEFPTRDILPPASSIEPAVANTTTAATTTPPALSRWRHYGQQ